MGTGTDGQSTQVSLDRGTMYCVICVYYGGPGGNQGARGVGGVPKRKDVVTWHWWPGDRSCSLYGDDNVGRSRWLYLRVLL